jgi:hypothetical protein
MISYRRGLSVLLGLIVGAGGGAGWAQTRLKRGPTATFHMLRRSGNALQARAVSEAIQIQLGMREDLRFTQLREIFEPASAADKQLKEAAAEAAKGKASLDNLEINEGVAALERAVKIEQRVFHVLSVAADGMNRHVALLGDLALAHFLAGDKDKCQAALTQAFTLSPRQEFDTKKYPPQMRRLFDATHFLMDELGTGSLRVNTTPQGAEVRANGSLLGFSPVVARSLPATNNLITVSLPGYRTRTTSVTVDHDKLGNVTIPLEVSPGGGASLLQAAMVEIARDSAPRSMSQLARHLQRRVLFLATADVRDDVVETSVTVYDDAAGRILGLASGRLTADSEAETNTLVSSMIALLSRPAINPRKPRTGGDPWLKRFYRSRYFWPIVGGVAGAAVIGAGVSLGVYYGTRQSGDRSRRFIVFY